MGTVKNIICEPSNVVGKIKIKILELISLNKVICNNLPNLEIPDTLPSIPSINPSQAVIDFLKDILAVLQSINFEQMRIQLIDWLIEQLRPLEVSLSLNLKLGLKECFACKISPVIPEWLFKTMPNSGNPGFGINIELKKLDLTCLFHVNPNSPAGALLYDGDILHDMNTFLWQVIQDNNLPPNAPRPWKDPVTNKTIAWFTYLENELTGPSAAYMVDGNGDGKQDSEARPMVFKMQIDDSYHTASIIDFINDYINSQNPLFDVDKVVPNTINFIYGTITNKIELPDECIGTTIEFEQALEDYVNVGIDNPEVTLDESFYEFTPEQMVNIKEKVANKKLGVKRFDKCCGRKISKVSFDSVLKSVGEVQAASTLTEKITVYKKSMDGFSDEASSNVPSFEKSKASADFFSNFISGLQIALTKMVLSPKNLIIIYTMFYLVNGKMIGGSIKSILRAIECILRKILGDLIKKLIYEFLLPLIINALKDMIICVIIKKLKEKNINYRLSLQSLLPGGISDKLEKLNDLMGKSGDVVDKVQGFTNKINLNSLNNINLQSGKKGKFCP